MTSVNHEGDALMSYTKGAPKETLAVCSKMILNGTVAELDDRKRKTIVDQNAIARMT